MAYQAIECAHCGKSFEPLRKWARFCCLRCKAKHEWAEKCAKRAAGYPDSREPQHAQQEALPPPFGAPPEAKVDPLRYRPPLLDKDIRDRWARHSPGNLEIPDLPAFLKRKPPPDGLGA